MVSKKRYSYIRDCAKLNGSSKYIEHIKGFLDSKKYKQIKEFMDKKRYSVLTHLKLYTALDRRNNHVLMVGFPGDRVSLRRMPTPELSDFMYYMFRFWDDNKKSLQTPLYILGHAFDDTHLRKFSLLKKFIKNIVILQDVNIENFLGFEKEKEKCKNKKTKKVEEATIKKELILNELKLYALNELDLDLLAIEMPCNRGTKKEEAIDLLAVSNKGNKIKEKSLVVIEIKFVNSVNHYRLRNVFFQGLDYLRWCENNKTAIDIIYSTKRNQINTKKRCKLLLINMVFPEDIKEFIKVVRNKDKYQDILLYTYECDEKTQKIKKIEELKWKN